MAAYSDRYPLAFHVVPLFAFKGVWEREAVLCKGEGTAERPTTARIDRALGIEGFVHLYLATNLDQLFDLPILRAQLGAAVRPPFPHGVLVLPTHELSDSESLICNWNLAVSRPGTGTVKGGNWTRGTRPERIAAVWDSFRANAPTRTKARGFFNEPFRVPTLRASQISANLDLLKRAPGGMPELLLRSPLPLHRFRNLCLFSRRDVAVVERLGPFPLPVAEFRFPGYAGDLVPSAMRQRIESYFAAPLRTPTPEFDFDAIRPVERSSS